MNAVVTLDDWNRMHAQDALDVLLTCSRSSEWASALVASRPYPEVDELLESADWEWRRLGTDDWLRLIAEHDRLADADRGALSAESRGEQAGIYGSDPMKRDEMAAAAAAYEEHFGFMFIADVRGRGVDEVLREIRERLRNSETTELRIASDSIRSIAAGRLRRTFASAQEEGAHD